MFTSLRRRTAGGWFSLPARHVYYVLAAINLATIVALLLLSHWIFTLYKDSVEANRLWARRQVNYLELIQRTAAVNAPGNDVFASQDPEREAARLAEAIGQHAAAFQAARHELQQQQPSSARQRLLARLDEAGAGVEQIERHARLILTAARQGDGGTADREMAAMDRCYAQAVEKYIALLAEMRQIQEAALHKDVERGSWLRWLGAGLSAGVVVLVTLLSWYGHLLARRIGRQQATLQETQGTLLAQNEQLTRQAEELRQAQHKAEEASRSKSEFLANMSHEIRTPMTAILGFAENLLSPELSPDDQTLAVQTIRRNGEHLLEIINDILDLSKIEAGRFELERIPCSLVQLLADVTSLMRVRADAKRLELRVEYASPVPQMILSDPTRLRQILINLIGNAIKFTSRGTVRVIAQMNQHHGDAGELRIDVIDTGLGMTPKQVAGLFQPFTQADTSTTRQFGGTGLGLSISQRIVEMLGGAIAVASRPGQGTTFATTIPVQMPPGTAWIDRPSEAVTQPRKTDTQGIPKVSLTCSVLLAEDGPDNQRLISFLLRKAGATVTIVDNGQAALDQAWEAQQKGQPFDVILMDMQMPVMDGYSAASMLRQRHYPGAIIALTAHAMSGDRERCLTAGCDDFVTKPVDRALLLRTIDRYVSGPSRTTTSSGFGKPVREA